MIRSWSYEWKAKPLHWLTVGTESRAPSVRRFNDFAGHGDDVVGKCTRVTDLGAFETRHPSQSYCHVRLLDVAD